MSAHRWESRPAYTEQVPRSDGRGGMVLEPRLVSPWCFCSSCGVSQGMAEHMGWRTCDGRTEPSEGNNDQ